jgi:site-specific DNA recombinase
MINKFQKQRSVKMTPSALYARVSTKRQEQETTIESQLSRLLSYAQQNGYHIAPDHQFIDQAVSGKGLARPGLDRLRDTAMTGSFTVLLCLSPDRLARNVGIQQLLLEELKRFRIQVIFLNQPKRGESPQDQLLLNIEGVFAEYERAVIRDRMRRGQLHRLRQGESMPSPAPYGYGYQPATKNHGGYWLVEPKEAEVVSQVFRWYIEETISIFDIVDRLNAQKIPSAEGSQWGYSSVQRMLHQSAYKGITYFNRRQQDFSSVGQPRRRGLGRLLYPRKKARPAEEWIEIPVPAIVDETTWQAAQEKLEMNARFAKRHSWRFYLFRGLLVCGICGRLLQGCPQMGRISYRCPHGGKHRPSGVPAHTCSISSEMAEEQVWQALAELLRHPQRIQQAWEIHRAQQAAKPAEMTKYKQRQKLLNKQRQRLLDAYQAGVISLDDLTHRQNPIEIELKELETKLASVQHSAEVNISLDQFMKHIEHALQSSDQQTKREVIRLLIERIVVTEKELIVEHIIPVGNDNNRLEPTRQSW